MLERHLVLAGNGVHGLVELVVVHANAGAIGHLQLQVFDDDLVEYLLAQFCGGRHGSRCLRYLVFDLRPALVELTLEYDILIHESHDLVHRYRLGMDAADAGHRCDYSRNNCKQFTVHIHVPGIH